MLTNCNFFSILVVVILIINYKTKSYEENNFFNIRDVVYGA